MNWPIPLFFIGTELRVAKRTKPLVRELKVKSWFGELRGTVQSVHEKNGISKSGLQESFSIALGHQNVLGSLLPSDLQEDDLPFQDVTYDKSRFGKTVLVRIWIGSGMNRKKKIQSSTYKWQFWGIFLCREDEKWVSDQREWGQDRRFFKTGKIIFFVFVEKMQWAKEQWLGQSC